MQSEFVIFMQFFLTGLSMGSIYALVALGFVLIYKSTSILNLAQGCFHISMKPFIRQCLLGRISIPR